MNKFRYAGIETFDINNGTGFGVTLFVQGCTHHCRECHNPTTWLFDGGKPFDDSAYAKLKHAFEDPNIRRLTISGGEPFDNYCAVEAICRDFKKLCPEKRLWIYTGYTYEELWSKYGTNSAALTLCDVLVDGEFQIENRDLSLPFKGSSNQRIIDMNKTRAINEIVLLELEGD